MERRDMAAGTGGGQKINFLKQYLSTLEKNTLIVFTDSYDVIANNHVTELLDVYKTNYNGKIVSEQSVLVGQIQI